VEHWHGFSDLRALADVKVDRGEQRHRLIGVLLVKRPGSVRFEALSPFGQPFLFVTVHAGRLTAYNATTNEATVGPATAETTARLLGLPFDPDDLVAALVGLAVPPEDLRAAEIVAEDGEGSSLVLHGAVNRKRVWLSLETGVVRQQEIIGGRYQVRTAYERGPDGHVTAFELDAAQSQVTGRVQYRNAVFGGGIDPERFTFAVPDGAKIRRLDQ
jgi:outer membrane lipoprotein-sorting protein